MNHTMTAEQKKDFIDLMNFYDNDSEPVYKTVEDIAKKYEGKIEKIIEEFLELSK